jgi:FixJ family two-component response regulator
VRQSQRPRQLRSVHAPLCRSAGFRAAVFSCAEAFLSSDQRHDTGCLIPYVQIPQVSGLDLQKHLKETDYRIPIISRRPMGTIAHAKKRSTTMHRLGRALNWNIGCIIAAREMATILVVDDDRMILDFCNRVLAGLSGFRVLLAHNGEEAMDIARRHDGAIELLVSDILMPGEIDGVELAKRVAFIRPEIQVLLISGYPSEGFRLRDSWHFLPKPFGPKDLVSKTEAILATRYSIHR